jgi:hypothetical protein
MYFLGLTIDQHKERSAERPRKYMGRLLEDQEKRREGKVCQDWGMNMENRKKIFKKAGKGVERWKNDSERPEKSGKYSQNTGERSRKYR